VPVGSVASQVLAVGDSLEHDVAGAAAAGLDCAFIAGGIHADEVLRRLPPASALTPAPPAVAPPLHGEGASSVDLPALQRLCKAQHGGPVPPPQFAMPYFQW
jgi:hypothetical protein